MATKSAFAARRLRRTLVMVTASAYSFMLNTATAQMAPPYVRIAKIVVDTAQVENYKAALKEGVETAVRVEPGVLSLQAVFDENNPTRITVFEVYASKEAYQRHIQTPHFQKYKTGTQQMVKSLELTDVIPIALAVKQK